MPVITISRQYGSGGVEVAKRLCEVLGYSYFDKNLMARVAQEVALSEDELVDLTEDNYKMRSFTERLFGRRHAQTESSGAGARNANALRVETLDEAQCINLVKDTVFAAYSSGNVVIVGRGGQAILREKPGVLHVRLTAPLGARALRVKEREGVSLNEATELTRRKDLAAEAYLNRFYGVDWDNPLLYHVVLNTGWWELSEVTELIIDALSHLHIVSQG